MNSVTLTAPTRRASDDIATGKGRAATIEDTPVAGSIAGKVIAITGASSGIGAAVARLAARHGAHVVIGARRQDRLAALAEEISRDEGSVRHLYLDVAHRRDMLNFIDYATDQFGRLDVMVNNAGAMFLSPISALRVEDWVEMIDINLRGTLHGIAAALPVMQQQGFGQIINIAANPSQMASPNAAVYAATKAAVRAISEGLRLENDAIRVTVISPGVTETELADRIADPVIRCETRARRSITISAEAVARAILFAMEQPAEVDVSEIVVRPTANPF
jgi:NADP-dependent 3-hydroxy acid dehydrogenase YdfG